LLRKKLLEAIEYSSGYGLDATSNASSHLGNLLPGHGKNPPQAMTSVQQQVQEESSDLIDIPDMGGDEIMDIPSIMQEDDNAVQSVRTMEEGKASQVSRKTEDFYPKPSPRVSQQAKQSDELESLEDSDETSWEKSKEVLKMKELEKKKKSKSPPPADTDSNQLEDLEDLEDFDNKPSVVAKAKEPETIAKSSHNPRTPRTPPPPVADDGLEDLEDLEEVTPPEKSSARTSNTPRRIVDELEDLEDLEDLVTKASSQKQPEPITQPPKASTSDVVGKENSVDFDDIEDLEELLGDTSKSSKSATAQVAASKPPVAAPAVAPVPAAVSARAHATEEEDYGENEWEEEEKL
jgi:hypothetical protein